MAEAARMSVELQESINRTYAKASQIRPKNTQRAYNSRQREFLDWCTAKGPAFSNLTRTTVTGEKLHLFLEECVIGRSKRHKNENGCPSTERKSTIGRSTVNSYVAAMIDLWKQQVQANINSNPSPRNEAVKALLKVTEYEEDERKRKNFEDRGVDTMLDGYTTTDQIRHIAQFFWESGGDSGVKLRNLMGFLMSHYALMRGEASRKMELADIHSVKLENEGYSPCRAVVMVMRQGKTNQVGRIEVGAFLRNKFVEICPHGLLGFYLFWRFHVEREPFPDFTSSDRWYPTKLLKTGKDPTVEMSYKVHREAMATALKSVGIYSKAKTHIGRGSGARMADLAGASEAQIRRLGRWNNQVMEKCYLTSLPREAMRTLAGFEPANGSYFLARAHVEPSITLQRQVFPQVEPTQSSLNNGDFEQTIAAGGFLELLQYLRIVVLQDAVFMSDRMPGHPIWQHKIFQSAEFLQYKCEAKRLVSEMDDPSEQRLQKAMPVLQSKLDGVHHDLKAAIEKIGMSLQNVERSLNGVMQTIVPLSCGTAVVEVRLVPNASATSTTASFQPGVVEPSPAPSTPTTPPVSYALSRSLVSVHDLWKEWSVGLNGGPAVSVLEEKYGTKWCNSDERRFFNRRRRVISLVKEISAQLADSGVSDDITAVQLTVDALEAARKSQKKSLNWMSNNPEVIIGLARSALRIDAPTVPAGQHNV